MKMCHMWSDGDDAELHAMADKIGVARKWFQLAVSGWKHYDVSLSMKAKAIANGAVLTDRYGPVLYIAMIENDWRRIWAVANSRIKFPGNDYHNDLFNPWPMR